MMRQKTEIEPKSNRAMQIQGMAQPVEGRRHSGRLRGGVQCHKFRQAIFL